MTDRALLRAGTSLRRGGLVALAALACGWWPGEPARAAPAAAGPCISTAFRDTDYVVCSFDLSRHRLRLFWKDHSGEPYGSLDRLRAAEGPSLIFAMNAGMYQRDLSPLGLYIENGREARPVNTARASGNFYLKPNGIFYIAGDRAGVVETGRFLKQRPRPEFATQSGPMLLIDGRLHPKISEDGVSRKRRNGVCVRGGRVVVFALSRRPVTFADFAGLFRDVVGCRDALFLDGSISTLYAPALGTIGGFLPIGPIVAAFPR